MIRTGLVAIVCAPFLVSRRRYLTDRAHLKTMFVGGFLMFIAMAAHVKAIELSSASYMSVIALAYPIALIVVSILILKEKVDRQALAGISLGALGGGVLLLLPLVASGNAVAEFNLMATIMGFTNITTFAAAIIIMRKQNKNGVPLIVQIGFNSIIVAILSGLVMSVTDSRIRLPADPSFWLAAAYSGVGVMLLARLVYIKSLQYIGAARLGALNYVGVFVAILLPIILIGEHLSLSMIIGGMLILLGVYLLERDKPVNYKKK